MTITLCGELMAPHTEGVGLIYDRTRYHVAEDLADSLFLHMNTGKNAIIGGQFDRTYTLGQGDAALWVQNAPVRSVCLQDSGMLGIHLSRESTANWMRPPEDLAAVAGDRSSPVYKALTAYMALVRDSQTLDPDIAAVFKSHISDLTGLWLGGLKPRDWVAEAPASRHAARVAAIRELVARFAGIAGLDAAQVGHRLGLSERTVQHTLTQEGLTFSRLLALTRVDKAVMMLGDPAHARHTVTEIAFLCGFTELSGFYRAFKQHRGETPGAFRGDPGRDARLT
ncbi:helix-turn-helix transcriptional regulator [Novosphingobium sp.]|uniref:AraC family transcriptional regulator n=1 Tax=Novosphingobium sp. TaxID=1874826 RepID=UPI00333EEABE